MLKYSTISAATLGVIWSAIHMAYMARSGPDSLGIRAFLMPLSFVAGCIFFFFLLWMPFLFIALIFRRKTVAPHAIRKARIVLILSIVPFLPCLYLFVTAPGMVRYHPFHLSQCSRRVQYYPKHESAEFLLERTRRPQLCFILCITGGASLSVTLGALHGHCPSAYKSEV